MTALQPGESRINGPWRRTKQREQLERAFENYQSAEALKRSLADPPFIPANVLSTSFQVTGNKEAIPPVLTYVADVAKQTAPWRESPSVSSEEAPTNPPSPENEDNAYGETCTPLVVVRGASLEVNSDEARTLVNKTSTSSLEICFCQDEATITTEIDVWPNVYLEPVPIALPPSPKSTTPLVPTHLTVYPHFTPHPSPLPEPPTTPVQRSYSALPFTSPDFPRVSLGKNQNSGPKPRWSILGGGSLTSRFSLRRSRTSAEAQPVEAAVTELEKGRMKLVKSGERNTVMKRRTPTKPIQEMFQKEGRKKAPEQAVDENLKTRGVSALVPPFLAVPSGLDGRNALGEKSMVDEYLSW